MKDTDKIMGTKLIFRNFAGKQTDFNRLGDRNTCVVIPDDRVQEFIDKGYNVKIYQPKDEQAAAVYYIKARINFERDPLPKIYLITSLSKPKKLNVDERKGGDPDEVNQLDWSDIESIDIEISPWAYNKNGRSGVSAYIRQLYVKLIEDPFYEKYNIGDFEDD